jgi:hypothetical protein
MSGTRNLTGLVTAKGGTPPSRTVAAPPPRRRTARQDLSGGEAMAASPVRPHEPAVAPTESPRQASGRGNDRRDKASAARDTTPSPAAAATVRISVNIPLSCKQWLARQAREQQRFVSEIVMEALDQHGDDASPPSGRAKRVAVPDGAIYNIVLPVDDRRRIDDLAATKRTTRSALLTEILRRATGS